MSTRDLARSFGRPTGILLALAIVTSTSAEAQEYDPGSLPREFAFLSGNAILGALSAGVGAWLSNRSVSHAFTRGALGGAIGYAGKRLAVANWGAAPPLGRTLAAVGSSAVRNAARGTSLLDSVSLAIGPLQLDFGRTLQPRVTVDVHNVFLTVYAATVSDLHLDWSQSVKALTPVFHTERSRIRHDGQLAAGVTVGRLIVLDHSIAAPSDDVFRHELVHVLQQDHIQLVWERPAEASLRRIIPGAGHVPVFMHFAVVVPMAMDLIDSIGAGDGLFERLMQAEAEWLERR